VSQGRFDRAAAWFRGNVVGAVALSRFVPGMRLPTYLAAGALRAPLHRFVLTAVAASLVWTTLLLFLAVELGEAVLPWLGRFRWPAAALALVAIVGLQWRATRRLDRRERPKVASTFEFWPPWLFYTPVALYWACLAIRHRGATLPTAANPSIFSGGFIGESKSQILGLVPDPFRRWIAPYTVFERPAGALDEAAAQARLAIAGAGLAFPIVAKPDRGQRGDGVRPLFRDEDLRSYVAAFPVGQRIVFQKLVGPAGSDRVAIEGRSGFSEAGILYWRRPGAEHGEVFSITLKEFPVVLGDGRRTLRQLIEADARARLLAHVYLERHTAHSDRVLGAGEPFPLVFAGNHCQGAIFRDGTHLATPELLQRIDGIARAMPEFYFGRFDVRFSDLERFLLGDELHIVEINGAGAEATHIWDASMTLRAAYLTLFRQLRILFAIGAANRRRGHRPIRIGTFVREALAYRRLARCYPLTH
jgi:hypothetical protein